MFTFLIVPLAPFFGCVVVALDERKTSKGDNLLKENECEIERKIGRWTMESGNNFLFQLYRDLLSYRLRYLRVSWSAVTR